MSCWPATAFSRASQACAASAPAPAMVAELPERLERTW